MIVSSNDSVCYIGNWFGNRAGGNSLIASCRF
jgi:hypothetical protein